MLCSNGVETTESTELEICRHIGAHTVSHLNFVDLRGHFQGQI